MNDQASLLRDMMQPRTPVSPSPTKTVRKRGRRARIVAVTSGKGGVGKTNISVNLAVALRQRRRRVLMLDMDLGLANVDLLFNIEIPYNLVHVINGRRRLKDVIIRSDSGVDIIGGASGIESLANLDSRRQKFLLEQLITVENEYDFIIIDTGAGISSRVMNFVRASDHVVLVTQPEQPSVLDAYVVLKLLARTGQADGVKMVVNMCAHESEGTYIFEKLFNTAGRRLGARISCLGYVPWDNVIREAVRARVPFYLNAPGSPASRAIDRMLSDRMWGGDGAVEKPAYMSFFRKLVSPGRRRMTVDNRQ